MKKSILILVFFAVTNLFGQEAKRFDYQVSCGTTVSMPYPKIFELWKFEGSPIIEYSSDFGYFCEFLVSYHINSKLTVNMGLNYNYNRVKVNFISEVFKDIGNRTNSYVSLPVFMSYRIDKIPLSFSVGTYLGLLTNANEKGTISIDTAKVVLPDGSSFELEPIEKYDRNIKDVYDKFDFGISSQVDYQLKISEKLNGVIFTRFNYGLKNVIADKNAWAWKNYNLMIGLGIKF